MKKMCLILFPLILISHALFNVKLNVCNNINHSLQNCFTQFSLCLVYLNVMCFPRVFRRLRWLLVSKWSMPDRSVGQYHVWRWAPLWRFVGWVRLCHSCWQWVPLYWNLRWYACSSIYIFLYGNFVTCNWCKQGKYFRVLRHKWIYFLLLQI